MNLILASTIQKLEKKAQEVEQLCSELQELRYGKTDSEVRIYSQAIESEEALLCSCFLRPDIIPQMKEQLSSSDFYRDAHAIIITALTEVGKESDPITIGEYIRQAGLLERTGGMEYITQLAETVSTSAGWKFHAEVIKDRAKRRNMILLCQKTMDLNYDLTTEYDETLSNHKVTIKEYESDCQAENETNLDLIKQIAKDQPGAEGGEKGCVLDGQRKITA